MLNGIDISSWQDGINIAALTTTDFVIVKATQGTSYTDSTFKKFVEAAILAGKRVGAYHYATGAGYQAEADHFLSVVKPYLGKILLALDWETGNSATAANMAFHSPAYAKQWLDYVAKQTGVTPVLYMSQSVAATKDWSACKHYPLWGAQYANMTTMGYTDSPWSSKNWGDWGTTPTMQQYTSCGRITGYSGNLDLNLFYGSGADWDALCGGKTYTEGWVKTDYGWWYQYADGTRPAETWKYIDGKWYYFKEDGYMAVNQWQAGEGDYTGQWFYLGADGAPVTNKTLKIDGNGKVVPAGNYYYKLGDVPKSYRAVLDDLIAKDILKGKGGSGDDMILDMTEDSVRVLVIMNR